MNLRDKYTPNYVIQRLRKGDTLATLAAEMDIYPDQVYAYFAQRRGHTKHLHPHHLRFERTTMRRIQHKRDAVRAITSYKAGAVKLTGNGDDPYGESLTETMQSTLVGAVEALTGSSNLTKTADLTKEWADLGWLATHYCYPLRRAKRRPDSSEPCV